jgi:peptidoglycan hydrolase FlgJ
MSIESVGSSPAAALDSQDRQLRQAARDLEGVFIAELFKAMRETIPDGGVVDGGMGEDIFTSLLDEHLAPQMSAGWKRGLGDALYRQLRAALPEAAPAEGDG